MALGRIDDIASLVPIDEDGVPQAVVESPKPAVRGRVGAELDQYRSAARPVDPTVTP